MLPNRETLCSYRYDPLDRLVDCTPSAQAPTRRFYLKDRLASEIQDAVQRSIMQHEDQLLAQQQHQSGAVEARLLATDQQRSVLNVLHVARPHPLAYSPYGHRPAESGLLSLLGFNGERPDPVTGCYLLGNGYRAFNPVLMRLNSPDSWSPFGRGGLNAYTYCVGDPVNRSDPTGHFSFGNPLKGILNLLKFRTPSIARPTYNLPTSDYFNTGSTSTRQSLSSFKTPSYASIQSTPEQSATLNVPLGGNIYESLSSIGPSASLRGPSPMYVPIPKVTTQRPLMPKSNQSIQKWIDSTTNLPDSELEKSVQIPRPGAELHNLKRQAVQTRGVREGWVRKLKSEQKPIKNLGVYY
jgi:RHS repeat-associated protein